MFRHSRESVTNRGRQAHHPAPQPVALSHPRWPSDLPRFVTVSYTLDEIARFDELGLWSFRQVWFSRFGTLVSTVEALVVSAEAGYDASELEALVNVEAKQALLSLVRSGRLEREQVSGRYVYLSPLAPTRRAQLRARSVYDAEASRLSLGPGLSVLPEELKAAIVLFYSLLDERQRRLYAGLEAMKVGRCCGDHPGWGTARPEGHPRRT